MAMNNGYGFDHDDYFRDIYDKIKNSDTTGAIGRIDTIVGTTVEAAGIRGIMGDICLIDAGGGRQIPAEIVGFRGERVILTPYENIQGLSAGSFVRSTGRQLRIPVGGSLRGRIIDAMGNPMDEGEPPADTRLYPIGGTYVNPLARPPIRERLDFGVKAIDGALTIGKGQRIGIFAGSGVGKSTLMGMIARTVRADINVIALVGERSREVREFIEHDLGPEGLSRSVVVVATSEQPAMLRVKCTMTATAIAEYFREQSMNVLLMMDSLTRFAMAQREISLSVGEPPIARGYTPSIYSELPKLLERSGNFERGSITGVYTVLVEGDDTNEPISDTVRGILDGHIVLSRRLAAKNHYPAIDVSASISRLMYLIVDKGHWEVAGAMRDMLATYNEYSDLITIGAYKPGANPRLDRAVSKIDAINNFLKQDIYENVGYDDCVERIKAIIA